ncbi:MAG: zf-HC2 domain-containing protein [Gemmatimonadales bacterium]
MSDQWTDRLSEFIDGSLAAGEREALEAHLPTCADCRTTLDELRQVVARAEALDDHPPATDLWPGIATRIGSHRVSALAERRGPVKRRFSFTAPQLLAAGVALALLSAAAAVMLLRSAQPEVTGQLVIGPTGQEVIVDLVNVGWSRNYDAAVADLRQALERNRAVLDTSTIRILEQNLAVIDRAIDQARRALVADPSSAYLNHHLADTMRRKLDLLRRANALVAARS